MEVINTNFEESLSSIEEVIEKATFLGIDCEFSGLNVVSEINAFDSPSLYYEKIRRSCKEFLVLQYGISAFRFDPEIQGFRQQSYNFYIFRRPINRNIPDQRFLCQTSSIHFLITQGFDFNKLFNSGISYLNILEENEYRQKLEEQKKARLVHNSSQNSDIVPVPDDMKKSVNDATKHLTEFLKSDNTEYEFSKSNAFLRKLIYQTVQQKFKDKIVLETRTLKNKDRVLVATRFKNKSEQDEKERKLIEEESQILENFIGFTKILRLIISSGKLVVGHNMCLDLLHTVDKFLTPLPEEYTEFKECVSGLFKNVLDTKFMASSEEFKDLIQFTILKDIVKTVSQDPFKLPRIEIETNGQGYSLDNPKEHEAGYDAYITGVCFISMWNYLGNLKNLSSEEIFTNLKLLGPYLNKIFLMMLRDNQYINLRGADPNPSRDHVFYLTFPKEWKTSNITELFSPFGGVYISWISDVSAYVALYKKEQAAVALNTLSQSETYHIMTYNNRQSTLKGIRTPLPSPIPTMRKRKSLENNPPRSKRLKFDSAASNSKIFQSITEEDESSPVKRTKTVKAFTESDQWE